MRYRNFAAVCFAATFGTVDAAETCDLLSCATPRSACATQQPSCGIESPICDSSANACGPSKGLYQSSLGSECGVQTPFWYLNSELTALSPINSAADQSYVLNDLVAPATVTPFASTVDANQLTAAPRLTFGKSNCNGWGVQTSYWGMNTTAGSGFAGPLTGPATVPDLNLINVQESFRAYTFDIEATKRLQVR